jgi:hypothetical protein
MMAALAWLEGTGLATWVREGESLWAFPMVLTLHTFGLGILVGMAAIVDLRLLGIGRPLPLAPMRTLFRIMWFGFAVNLVTGTLLFAAQATTRGASLFFLTKMALVAIGVAATVLIGRRVMGEAREPAGAASGGARGLAVLSIVAWTAAVCAGRLLAYV